jgi:hypothetical protein
LFYQHNEFDFSAENGYPLTPPSVLTYLVAITEPRRQAIRSIVLPWTSWARSKVTGAQIFTLITACQGLQSLELKLPWALGRLQTLNLPGFKESLVAVQGLKKLTITVEKMPEYYLGFPWAMQEEKDAKSVATELESTLEEHLKKPRSTT